MPDALKILKDDPNLPSKWLFKELRKQGLEYISSFSGKLWTDHNLHDPGITIMEVLCYAISDLGYRTNLNIEDILAPDGSEAENNFFTPEEILTCNPLTILDFRKMLVDISGVRNAWLVPAEEQEVPLYVDCETPKLQFSPMGNKEIGEHELILNGLYKVYLDIDPILSTTDTSSCDSDVNTIDSVLKEVYDRLHQHRNLCEDFLDVIVLQDEEIGLCSDIELEPDANPNEVLEGIYEAVEAFLSPRLQFYSLKEMIERGKPMEEIFEGRPYTPNYSSNNEKYSHGFVDSDELEAFDLPERLLASDLYQTIMNVPGVRAIKSLLISSFKDGLQRVAEEEWALTLMKNHRPLFAPNLSTFNFFKGVIRLSADRSRAINRFKKRLGDYQKNKFEKDELDSRIPYGNYRSDLSSYISIQHEFPLVYGIGRGHLSKNAPEKRKVEALQLKAYLTFFDQILAGYLSQLANVRQLFSWKNIEVEEGEEEKIGQTYFQQTVENIPEAEKIFLSLEKSGGEGELEENQIIAMPPEVFSHPTERDMAILQMIELFNNYDDEDGEDIIEVVEEADGNFRFYVIGVNELPVLQSKDTYATAEEAQSASEVLFFQGTLAQTYENANWPDLKEYSFYFVYKKVDYEDYLKSITESESEYYARKDKFLNHLLARFGEEFTEYVLLMYALNQEAPDPKDIVADKARFLEQYPDISRNRGRGFDYTSQDNIWNSDANISGFEKRVAGLMGLANWERRNLNNFEVVLREQQYLLRIKDHRGTLLFETEACYSLKELPAAKEEFTKLICDPQACDIFECSTGGVFGFRLMGKDGKIFATYARTFGSEALRDEILACTQSYFCKEPHGLILKIVAEKEGWYFLLLDEEEKEIYLKSSDPYPTEQAACYAWVKFVELAKIADNYVNVEGNYDGGPYSFAIFSPTEEGEGEDEEKKELAYHPKGYPTKAVRTKKKKKVVAFITSKKGAYEIEQLPERYSWTLLDKEEEPLLRSDHQFKTTEQANDAWEQFLPWGANSEQYTDVITLSGDFSFWIYKEEVILAKSRTFTTEEERDIAKEKTWKAIQKEEATSTEKLCVTINNHPGEYIFKILGAKGQVGLIGTIPYPTPESAACAYYHFLNIACEANNYKEVIQEGTCWYSFQVTKAGAVVAYHPEFYLCEEKNEVQKKLIAYIQENKIPFALKKLPGTFHYEIGWENCQGHCEVLLEEKGYHNTPTMAEDAAKALLQSIKAQIDTDPLWTLFNTENDYGFAFEEAEIRLAEHPRTYTSETKRDQVAEDAKKYFEHYFSLLEDPENTGLTGFELFMENNLVAEEKWEICGTTCEGEEEVCLLSGFRLGKSDHPIAYHPTSYINAIQQNKVIQRLLIQAQCNQLVYSDLCVQGERIVVKIDQLYYYEIWENKQSKLLWRSSQSYNSLGEAEEAFAENWLRIIELAKVKSNYHVPNAEYPYWSIWEDGVRLAYCPETFNSETETYEKQDEWIRTARQVPVYLADDGYRFQMQNEDASDTIWESALAYETAWYALQAFYEFFNLLSQETNYRRDNNKEACIFNIEIGETLLEGSRTYADVFNIDKLASFVNDFSTRAEALQKIPEIITATENIITVTSAPTLLQDVNDLYYFNLTDLFDTTIVLWNGLKKYPTASAAIADFNLLKELWLLKKNYLVIERDNGKFSIIIQRLQVTTENAEDYKAETVYAACPAIYERDNLQLAGNTILVSSDCNEYGEDDTCIQKLCPAAWDVGLQTFLFHAIYEDNFYTYMDYQKGCQWSFRVVNDAYRMARNLREFHLPAHQAQYKDWLYGYSRCDKEVIKELPAAKILKRNGLYHYYLEGEADKVIWCSNTAFPELDANDVSGSENATQLFNAEYLRLFCLARKAANYKTKILDIDGEQKYSISLEIEAGSAVLSPEMEEYYDTAAEAEAAIQCSVIYAKALYAYFCDDTENNKPNFTIKTRADGQWIYCISIPELLWRSYAVYEEEKVAIADFKEKQLDFYAYAQELDFYELAKENAPGEGRLLQLLDENCAILAQSFQTFQNGDEWNPAVLRRIEVARKMPYFSYEDGENIKYGFRCFSMENAPEYELRARTDCDPEAPEEVEAKNCETDTEDIINVEVPGEVIWESILEYESQEELECAFEKFLKLLESKNNYQATQLEDCNLFGLELTDPDAVLANHPQTYVGQNALKKAIQRTQECINAEGFHLIEHILLRPKNGVKDHITLQFLNRSYQECPDVNEALIPVDQPYLLLRFPFPSLEKAQEFKDLLYMGMIEFLKENLDANSVFDAEGLKEEFNESKGQGETTVNTDEFVDSLYNRMKEALDNGIVTFFDGEWLFPEGFLDDFVFCFNKSNSDVGDKLVSICPDCENIEELPAEEASAAACEDPKLLLTATDDDSSSLGGTSYIAGADPYSFWTTIILPYWPQRFQNANFRHFFEDTLRREAPAHIGLRICWLDPKQMLNFESNYRSWLEAFSGNENCKLKDAQNQLVCNLFDDEDGISNVYPPAQLQGGKCAPGSGDPNAVLLDFTQLG